MKITNYKSQITDKFQKDNKQKTNKTTHGNTPPRGVARIIHHSSFIIRYKDLSTDFTDFHGFKKKAIYVLSLPRVLRK